MIQKTAINAKWAKCLVSAPPVVEVEFSSLYVARFSSLITQFIQSKWRSILVNATGFLSSPALQSLETKLIPEAIPTIISD